MEKMRGKTEGEEGREGGNEKENESGGVVWLWRKVREKDGGKSLTSGT